MFLHVRAATVAKLLLVEDDNNLREIYQARLSAEGYDIVAAQNGEEALSVAKQHRPDLIISDVMMPRISGFEMLDILRATPELSSTKVIMLTALGQAEDQARAGKLGADKYLVKSQVTLEDIVNCARDLIDGTTVVAPDPQQAPAPAPTPEPPQPVLTGAAVSTAPQQAAVTADPTTAVSPAVNSVLPPIPSTSEPSAIPKPLPSTDGSSVSAVPSAPDPLTTPLEPPATAPVSSPVVATVQDPDPLNPPATSTARTIPVPPPTEPPQITTHKASMLVNTESTSEAGTEESRSETPSNVTSPAPAAQVTQPATPAEAPTPTPASTTDNQQSLAAEEAAIESQIEAFATTPSETEAPQLEGAQAVIDSNEAVLNEAVQDLAAAVNEPPTPALAPSEKPIPGEQSDATAAEAAPAVTPTPQDTNTPMQPETPATPAPVAEPTPEITTEQTSGATEEESDQVNVAGKKVIQPINDITKGPNLDELLAKEVAKETAQGTTGSAVVSSDPPAPATPADQPPAAPTTGDDPNSIAL